MQFFRLAMFALLLAIVASPARADVWDDAYEPLTRTRFIPLELILGARWNGSRTISYPQGTFRQEAGGSTWVGPRKWTHPVTGARLQVYDRSRTGVQQIFAVRDDQAAIGRVADSRNDIRACDGEGKFPLGLWRQGESRTFEYTCWYGRALHPRAKVATINILRIDYDCSGSRHCLAIEWLYRNRDRQCLLDRHVYVFAPERSMISERRLGTTC